MQILTLACTIEIHEELPEGCVRDCNTQLIKIKNHNEYKVLINSSGRFLYCQGYRAAPRLIRLNEENQWYFTLVGIDYNSNKNIGIALSPNRHIEGFRSLHIMHKTGSVYMI